MGHPKINITDLKSPIEKVHRNGRSSKPRTAYFISKVTRTKPYTEMFVPLILLVLLLLSLLFLFSRKKPQTPKLPPGPHPWPIVGNLLQLGKMPHVKLASMARTHGPLISLRFGAQLVVIATSPQTASQILKTHDRALSARNVPHSTPVKNYGEFSMIWAPYCDENWRALRAICRTELFSPRMIDAQARVREARASEMVGFIRGKEGEVVGIGEVVFGTVFNLMGHLVFSRSIYDLANGDCEGSLRNLIWRLSDIGASPDLANFFPVFRRFDVQGIKREVLSIIERIFEIWEVFMRERRESGGDLGEEDFLNVLIGAGFSDSQIKPLLLDIMLAGTETNAVIIEWAMAELIKSPEAMNKVRFELDRVIGDQTKLENTVRESQLAGLPYLEACIKETMRLHPPAPLLLPHRATEPCEVLGYTIPKDCQVMVNVWAIARDPETWQDPLAFLPDRFVDSDLDYKGNDFEFIPFGAGRRICPGLPLAARTIQLILATLLHSFDWCLADGSDPTQLAMEEKFTVTMRKEQPLMVIPKSRGT